MQAFTGFSAADFDLFEIPTLAGRMEAMKTGLRPKLEALGRDLAPELAALTGGPIYPIVAKHARRTVNPPDETWVAFSPNPRGYKMIPHFEIGLSLTRAFARTGVVYESAGKAQLAENLLTNLTALRAAIPGDFHWLEEYHSLRTIPHADMSDADFERIAGKLRTKKEADCMVGLAIERTDTIQSGPGFAGLVLRALRLTYPVYLMALSPVRL